MRHLLHFLSVVCLLFTLAACGSKGPLYLPKPPAAAPAAAPAQAPATDDSTGPAPAR
jgi:predicted small lipoprotein YifL